MDIRSIDELDVARKKVLVRVDFNVPVSNGSVGDATRIQAAVPTINYLLERNAIVILMSHLGRPRGKEVLDLSLKPVGASLETILGKPVQFASDTIGQVAREKVENASPGDVILLENLRFNPGEESNDVGFAGKLAALGDCYVNDAFGTAHRAHASTEGLPHLLPSAAGKLILAEIAALNRVVDNPEQPLTLILGGAKISDKIGVIQSFLTKAQTILIGGGMANTFLLADGAPIGTSLVEPKMSAVAKELIERAVSSGVELLVPCDVVVSTSLDSDKSGIVEPCEIASDEAIFDIGPATVDCYSRYINDSATIIWNGPMGVFEVPPYDSGTIGIADAVAASNGYSLVGGGDSVAALNRAGLSDAVGYVSTGGGASLEFLEGKTLPGIAALEK